MNPRLKNSKKWTDLPPELTDQISTIFKDTFKSQLSGAKTTCQGRIYTGEILLKVGFLEKGRLRQFNFCASFDYDKKKDNVLTVVHTGVDCIGSMMEQFFKNGATDMPNQWEEHDLGDKKVFLIHTTTNDQLEQQADELLGEAFIEEELIKGEDLEGDIDKAKKIIGIDDN